MNASVAIAGFTNAGNNGTFVITASTSTTFTVANASGVNETHAATAISSAVVLSPAIVLSATVGGGTNAASITDSWTIQKGTTASGAVNHTPTGPNPISALILSHTGSTNAYAALVVPNMITAPAGSALTLDSNNNGGGVAFTMQNGTFAQGTIAWAGGGGSVTFGLYTASANSGAPVTLGGWAAAVANSVCVQLTNQVGASMAPTTGTTVGLDVGNGAGSFSAGSFKFKPTSGTANFVAAQVTPIIDSTAAVVAPTISAATISSATAAALTVSSITGLVAGATIVISGVTTTGFTQLNGTWTINGTPSGSTVNITGSGWTTESNTSLNVGSTLTQTPGTYTALLVNPTETAVPSVAANLNMLLDLQVGGSRKWGVTNKGHEITGAANNDGSGVLTISSSTSASVVYSTPYNSTPVVIITPVGTAPSAATFYISASSATGFTVTASTSGSYTVNYMVVGNPT